MQPIQPTQPMRGLTIATIVLAAATIALAVFAVIQVQTLKTQVTISVQEFENLTRSWVGVKELHFNQIKCYDKNETLRLPVLTRQLMDLMPLFGTSSEVRVDFASIDQYVFQSKCVTMNFIYDATIKNYGSIPATSVEMVYGASDSATLRNNGNFTTIESVVPYVEYYKELVLMPQQETTLRLQYIVKLEDFKFLDAELVSTKDCILVGSAAGHEGSFGCAPDRFLIGLRYESQPNEIDTLGIIYKIGDTSALVMTNGIV